MILTFRRAAGALFLPCVLASAWVFAACSLQTQGNDYGVTALTTGAGGAAQAGSSGSGLTGSSGVGGESASGSGSGAGSGGGTDSGSGSGSGSGGGSGSGSASGSSGAGGAGGGPLGPVCGDGVIQAGEQCDDSNTIANDGCTGCVVDCEAPLLRDPATNHCYYLENVKTKTWQGARDACALIPGMEGSHLAVITSQAEMDFLKGLTTTDTWIGGNDLQSPGAWAWITGEPWSYAPWKADNPSGDGQCVEIGCPPDMDVGTLNDQTCDTVEPFLCERSPAGKVP